MRTVTKPVSGSVVALFLSLIVPTFTYTILCGLYLFYLGLSDALTRRGKRNKPWGICY